MHSVFPLVLSQSIKRNCLKLESFLSIKHGIRFPFFVECLVLSELAKCNTVRLKLPKKQLANNQRLVVVSQLGLIETPPRSHNLRGRRLLRGRAADSHQQPMLERRLLGCQYFKFTIFLNWYKFASRSLRNLFKEFFCQTRFPIIFKKNSKKI